MTTLQVYLSHHAVKRYVERVRPGLDWLAAQEQLATLVACAELETEPPSWWRGVECHEDGLVLIAGDLVIPLIPGYIEDEYVATTCVARGNLPASERRHRSNLRRQRRRARAFASAL
jgi:hypothetical protein